MKATVDKLLIEALGMGRQGGTAQGTGGMCVCKNCGYAEKHTTGSPCTDNTCPKCGVVLDRE